VEMIASTFKMAKEYIDHKQLLNLYAFIVCVCLVIKGYLIVRQCLLYAQQAVDYGIKYNAPRQIVDGFYLLYVNIKYRYFYHLMQHPLSSFTNKTYGATSWQNIQKQN
jgi:hypothetical protein